MRLLRLVLCISSYLLIHRAKYQQLLCEAAVEAGVSLNFGCPVASVDENTTTMVLKDGQRISADLIVGADGISTSLLLFTCSATASDGFSWLANHRL